MMLYDLVPGSVGREKEQRTLDDQVGAKDTHGRDTNTSLGGSVGGAKACEYNGGCASHRAEEGLSRVSKLS